MHRSFAALCALLIATSPALSNSRSTPEDMLRQMASRNAEKAKEQFVSQLFMMAPTGELTREMAETIDLRFEAEQRTRTMTTILRNDLDGNGELSREEIDRVRTVLSGNQRSQFETTVLKVDTDKDGMLSATEIAASGKEAVAELRKRGGRGRLQGTAFMVFDADGNGVVVVDDILKTIDRLAKEGPSITQKPRSNRNVVCKLPKPSPQALPVFVGGYEGTAVSTVAVAGLDNETSFATLEIEEGKEPLFIVANVFDAMVLRVTGATERVERFVGGSRKGMGVIGLPAKVVDLKSLSDCSFPTAYKANTSQWIKTRALLTAGLGREARMVGSYKLGQLYLPSGRSEKPAASKNADGGLIIQKGNKRFRMTEKGFEEIVTPRTYSALEADLRRYYPDGIESVSPEDIVTNGKAEAYDVLPQQAGLVQLMRSGALSRLSDGAYSIDKPIARFPAGLNGGHSVKFVLRRGVPMPEGKPGHSSVLIEETGECLGSRC